MPFADNAWLAGFAAGEGCFYMKIANRSDVDPVGHLQPAFALTLRIDDLTILERLRAEFGGNICVQTSDRGHPQARWAVQGKRDLPGLIAYFDRFPLLAKKADDYVVWRQAVRIYCRKGGYAPELRSLARGLRRAKEFVPRQLPPKKEKKLARACEFLADVLALGPVAAVVLYEESGFSRATLRRASIQLGVERFRRGGRHYWQIAGSELRLGEPHFVAHGRLESLRASGDGGANHKDPTPLAHASESHRE